jgi:hypothetical protein
MPSDHSNTQADFHPSSFTVNGITYSRPQPTYVGSISEAESFMPLEEEAIPRPLTTPRPAFQPPRAPPQHAQPTRLSQAEVDRLMASASIRRRPPQEQPLDFDPNNLTISERVGLNDMGIHRPRLYKRTGDKS